MSLSRLCILQPGTCACQCHNFRYLWLDLAAVVADIHMHTYSTVTCTHVSYYEGPASKTIGRPCQSRGVSMPLIDLRVHPWTTTLHAVSGIQPKIFKRSIYVASDMWHVGALMAGHRWRLARTFVSTRAIRDPTNRRGSYGY